MMTSGWKRTLRVECGYLDIGISEVRHHQLRGEISSIQVDCSRTSNKAFLTDSAETVDLDFGLIHQNISFKKASFHY